MRLIWGIFAGVALFLAGNTALAYATPRLKPPAPGPEYLSESDYALLKSVSKLLKQKKFAAAKGQTAHITDPVAVSLATWMYFMAKDPLVDLNHADAFFDSHSDWPMLERIQSHVEDRIPSTAPADDVLAFFDTRNPVSGDGKLALARALFSKNETAAGEFHLRDAWINHNYTVAQEKRILSSYSKRLRPEDHAARVDRLLWARQVTNARRVYSRLSKHERKKASARAALLMRAADGPRLYGNLSKTDQLDPGLLHAAVRYYRRSGNEKYAITLSRQAPDHPEGLRNPERWWDERQLLMRWALKDGRFADAYYIASHHGLGEGNDLSEAEFNAGWIALRFLNEPRRAEAHFLALASAVRSPISLSRAYYWAGRAAAENNEALRARSYYEKAAQYYYSYYGQLAAGELGGAALSSRFGPTKNPTPDEKTLFASRSTVAALRMLSDLDLNYEFMVFAYHIDDLLERPGEYIELAKLANGERAPHLSVRAGKVAIQRDAFAPDVAYPLIFVPEEAQRFVAPEIILGLSRQESEFNPRAFSRAGARGVMQLIPSTALITARKERMRYSRAKLLDDPVYNMTLGSAHLSHLLKRFDGSLIMTLAAYNAGAGRVDQWVAAYGDPRKAGIDPLDWVELVPFSETRNYIQRVLENIQVYRGRLNNTPIPGALASDLERGGIQGRVARTDEASVVLAKIASRRGEQTLAPLPARTALRINTFKTAMAAQAAEQARKQAEASAAAASANKPLRRKSFKSRSKSESSKRKSSRLPRTEKTKPDDAPPITNSILREEPAPEKINNGLESEGEKAIEPDPISFAADQPPIIVADENALFSNSRTEQEQTEAAIEQDQSAPSAKIENTAAARDENLNDAPIALQVSTAIVDDNVLEALSDPDDVDPFDEGCLTYRAFVAENAEDEAAAADLNAGMLAELESGGPACQ